MLNALLDVTGSVICIRFFYKHNSAIDFALKIDEWRLEGFGTFGLRVLRFFFFFWFKVLSQFNLISSRMLFKVWIDAEMNNKDICNNNMLALAAS